MSNLEEIVARALADLAAAPDPAALENAKAKYLGKSGDLSVFRSSLGKLPVEERKAAGQNYNSAVQRIEAALDSRRKDLELRKIESRVGGEGREVTLRGGGRRRGG
ncbi:MAG: phenylalanine--tRNA ligase subunit alpha, partial [Pseudomonadota bacterium]